MTIEPKIAAKKGKKAPAKKSKKTTTKPFLDLPIQWHLSNSKHDQCPDCGSKKITYVKKRHRVCEACEAEITSSFTTKDFVTLATAWEKANKEKLTNDLSPAPVA